MQTLVVWMMSTELTITRQALNFAIASLITASFVAELHQRVNESHQPGWLQRVRLHCMEHYRQF